MHSLTYLLKYWSVTPMGDAADDMYEMEMAWAESLREDISYLLELDDDKLRLGCAKALDPKIQNIREWPGNLSDKQRWCLAYWIATNEEEES